MFQLQIKKILKSSDLAVTINRKKVLKVFLKLGKPVSLKTIKSSISYIDRVTLFRILAVFEEKKIIHTINLESGYSLYALCNQDCAYNEGQHRHDHIHFKCDDCFDVICLPIDRMPNLSVPNYIVNNLNINASGVCANCNT